MSAIAARTPNKKKEMPVPPLADAVPTPGPDGVGGAGADGSAFDPAAD
jgi:hypothetical protein